MSGTLSLERAINQNRSVSLNVSADRVEYDDLTFNSNFDRQTAYVGFSSRVSRGEVQLSLGVNELHDQGETFSGTLANLSVNRRLSEISTVRVTYDRRFSDAGDLFTRFDDLGTPNQTPEDVIPIGDPFENERFSIAYEYERGNASFSLSAYLSEDEYQTATLFDSKRVGGTVGGALEFGSGWSLAADFGLENRDFETAGREDDYLVGTLTVERRLTRVVSVSLIYEHEDRASSTDGDDYVENRYSLIFSFRPGN